MLFFVIGGGCRHKYRLPHVSLKFVELQGAVIQCGRQPEAVIDQIFLARTVALVHAAHLPDGHMRLVNEHQRIARQVIDQGRWCLARTTAGEMPRIVLDALAEADLVEHFQIEFGPLLDALCLDQLIVPGEVIDPLTQLLLDRLDGAQHGVARRDIVRRREDRETQGLVQQMAR